MFWCDHFRLVPYRRGILSLDDMMGSMTLTFAQSYTDSRTGVTHIFARQLLNGLEVSDGDINLNIDRDGRIMSWGNSFHPGSAPDLSDIHSSSSGETEKVCATLRQRLDEYEAHLAELKGKTGVWGLVKSAAEVVLGSSMPQSEVDHHEIKKTIKSMSHIENHLHAVCHRPTASTQSMLSPVDAVVSLLPRLSPNDDLEDISPLELTSTPHHTLKPKPAFAEPPTEVISGAALSKAGVVSDVPARLMYTQVSEGAPRLVWKCEVEMKDSWYEAYVDVFSGELIRVVDWASDYDIDELIKKIEMTNGGKQKPLPGPPESLKPYSYLVFPWGELLYLALPAWC